MMNVAITKPELEKIVEERVRNGEYGSAEEVVAAALLLLEGDESLPAEELEGLRTEVMVGARQADRGEFAEFTAEDIIREETLAMEAGSEGKKK